MPTTDVAAAIHAARHRLGGPDQVQPSGAGSPEGTLAATVGTTYVDTNATFGAVLWIKATGTGTTGWKVATGDTGDIDVTPTVTIAGAAPITGDNVKVRRTPDHVTITIALASRSSIVSPVVVTLPTWARPARHRSVAIAQNGGTPNAMAFTDNTSAISLYSLATGKTTQVDGLTIPIATTATPWRTA